MMSKIIFTKRNSDHDGLIFFNRVFLIYKWEKIVIGIMMD
ncbi:hypothetical protein EW14_1515 [Prochlorococcus sp. MIT 0604]|nr:hypothetical protein EW14_1515 [Prochlorococcus sp. MIT 0604]